MIRVIYVLFSEQFGASAEPGHDLDAAGRIFSCWVCFGQYHIKCANREFSDLSPVGFCYDNFETILWVYSSVM